MVILAWMRHPLVESCVVPPKVGLLGTLSSVALGIGIAAGSSAASAQDQQRYVELCTWIQNENSVSHLQAIINRLSRADQNGYFDAATGQNYSKACLTLAAQKLVTLTATAEGPRRRV